jgi:hypothetical protein
MLTATLQARPFWLPLDFSIEIVRQGQIPVKNEISGDYVPEISIPAVPRNKVLLNHPDRISLRNNEVREYPDFAIYYNGSIKIYGTLVINEAKGGTYNGYVRGNIGQLSERQKQKSIRDFEYSKIERTFVKKATYYEGVDDYCTPEVTNNDFFNNFGRDAIIEVDDTEVETTSFNKWFYETAQFIVNKNDASGVISNNITFVPYEEGPFAINVVSPYLFVFSLLEKLLKEETYFIKSNDIYQPENYELAKTVLYSNFDITRTSIEATSADDNPNQGSRRSRRPYTDSIKLLNRKIESFKYAKLLPDMSLNSLLLSVQNLFNFIFEFDSLNRVSIIDREAIFEQEADDLDKYLIGKLEASGNRKNVTLKFSVKKDDTDSALSDMEEFDIMDRFDDVTYYGYLPYSIEGGRAMIAYGSPGDIAILDSGQIYEYKVITDDSRAEQTGIAGLAATWVHVGNVNTSGYYNLQKGNDVEKIETDFGAIMEDGERPFVSQPGSGNDRLSVFKQFSGRLIFYLGGKDCATHTDNYALSYIGEKGMINTRWQRTAEWWCHRLPVSCEINLPEHILKNLDINRKKRVQEAEFIIEKMVTKYHHTYIEPTQITGYKAD